MDPKYKKLLIGLGIAVIVIGAGTGIALYAANARKRKNASEVEDLLTIARNEGKMSEGEYQRYRALIYLDNYKLPSNYAAAYKKVEPYLNQAGNAFKQGFAVSGMQYLQQARQAANTLAPDMLQEYNKVESLLTEAFKLNATDLNIQQKVNNAKVKSENWWQVMLYLHPIGIVYNTASGYTENKYNELKNKYDRWTTNLLPENIDFNKRLITQNSTATLKLFSMAFAALSAGNDYFATQKAN